MAFDGIKGCGGGGGRERKEKVGLDSNSHTLVHIRRMVNEIGEPLKNSEQHRQEKSMKNVTPGKRIPRIPQRQFSNPNRYTIS